MSLRKILVLVMSIAVVIIVSTANATETDYPYQDQEHSLSFAQTNFGVDLVSFADEIRIPTFLSAPLSMSPIPRLTIGGLHFWGHADFLVSFPLGSSHAALGSTTVRYSPGIETSFKFYPWRIERWRLRPFIGLGFTASTIQIVSINGSGPTTSQWTYPLSLGLTYALPYALIELTARNSIGSQLNYGISSTQRAEVNLPQWSYMASIKMVKDVSYGTSKESSPAFGSMFFAVGPSSAWSVGSTSSYFENIRPAFGSQLNPALFPDVGFGYELGDSRMFFNLAYRPMRSSTSAYGISFQAKRQSLLFEVCKLLLNYHGFQPFIGVSINKEWLSYQEAQNGTTTQSIYNSTFTGGMTLGWDIRLKEKPWWILRTNLRYTPPLQIQMDSQNSMSFQNLEFNFIQIVFLPRYLRRSSI